MCIPAIGSVLKLSRLPTLLLPTHSHLLTHSLTQVSSEEGVLSFSETAYSLHNKASRIPLCTLGSNDCHAQSLIQEPCVLFARPFCFHLWQYKSSVWCMVGCSDEQEIGLLITVSVGY